ncbi:MAG TPA: TetR family transcriptional regulator [Allosphingosinicella sp.]|nr:TetR family transcriptional regulator [Allosphingosinicella sp.]
MSVKSAQSETGAGVAKARSRDRFEAKRDRILDAATDLINARGVKGTTLLEVARDVGLNTTSVTYYFRRKELLAAAVFERSLGRLEAMVADAAGEDGPEARVGRLLEIHVGLRADVIRGAGRPLADFSDIRALDDPVRLPLLAHYQRIFRQVRAFFGAPRDAAHKDLLTARTHILFEILFTMPVWISHHPLVDFPRVRQRLLALLSHGIALPDAGWAPAVLPGVGDAADGGEGGRANFLRVATGLINDIGYRGASIDRIVEELQVTKGSFYHHLDAKDDLVFDCFRLSYQRHSRIQTLAEMAGGDRWTRLSAMISALLDIQFDGHWPLLRSSALKAVPPGLHDDVLARSNRIAMRLAGMLVDGINEGSLRPVDPLIAGQVIMTTVNAAYDLRKWALALPRDRAIAYYSASLAHGLFDDRILDAGPVGEGARNRPSI